MGPKFAILAGSLCRTIGAAAAIFAAAVALPGTGQAQETTAVTASLGIVDEGRVAKIDDLDFGRIIPGDSGGTITIAPNGNLSTTGTLIASDETHPAAFELERRVFVDYPVFIAPTISDTVLLANTADPDATMVLTGFTTDFNRTGFLGLPAYFFATNFQFRVGGTLAVAANQKPGTYVGTFVVEIEYN